jgi:hypothetical protein
MSLEVINIGTSPNSGTGEGIRGAFIKTNNNFSEIQNTFSTTTLDVDGVSTLTQIHRNVTQIDGATGVVAHDCSTGEYFFHTNIVSDFTANLLNLDLDNGQAATITLLLCQGVNGNSYVPNVIQVDSVTNNVGWVLGALPIPTPNGFDLIVLDIARISNNYIILGRSTSHGCP